jgi:hypothetical protein
MQELKRSEEIRVCESCGRILYWNAPKSREDLGASTRFRMPPLSIAKAFFQNKTFPHRADSVAVRRLRKMYVSYFAGFDALFSKQAFRSFGEPANPARS